MGPEQNTVSPLSLDQKHLGSTALRYELQYMVDMCVRMAQWFTSPLFFVELAGFPRVLFSSRCQKDAYIGPGAVRLS